jgi:aspartate oxidase
MKSHRIIDADVLVLGGGAAGHAAALAAVEQGARVVQLYKGPAATAISTGFITFPVEERFGAAELRRTFSDIVGKGLCDRDLLECFITQGPGEILDAIARYDIPVDEAPRGVRARLQRGRTGRDLIGDEHGETGVRDMTGLVMEFSATHGTSLFSGLLKAVHASSVERVKGTAYRVLPDSRTVLAIIDGKATAINAGAIIFATGGVQGLFEFTDSPRSIAGDGLAMALDAGLALTDMEFLQFYPLALAEEGAPTVFLYPDFPAGGKITNAKGEDLLQKYFGDSQSLGDFDNWDHLSVVMHREILSGQHVFVDFANVPAENWDENSLTKIFLQKYIGDFTERPIRVSPIAHYTVGGIRIDADARTSAPGLYAAGEVAGGIHGANRHGGASLAECVVFGRIAGRNATEFARTNPRVESTPPDMPAPREGKNFDLEIAIKKLRKLNQAYLGPLRDQDGLARMARELDALMAETEACGWADGDEYIRIHGFRKNLMVAKVMRLFMDRRTESRGVHARADFPDSDPAWLKKQILVRDPTGELIFRDVPV